MRKHTVESYSAKLLALKGDAITFAGKEFLGVMVKQPHRCKVHGIWHVTPNCLISGSGCWQCDAENKRKAYTLTPKQVQERIDRKHKGNIVLVGNYVNNSTDVEFYCKKHDEHWSTVTETVIRGHGCPKCSHSGYMASTYKKKDYKLGKHIVQIQGYENFALDYILSKGIKPSEIKLGAEVPLIYYDKGRKHFPDMYIPKMNRIVEVKSTYTMLQSKDTFVKLKHKCKAAMSLGYDYKLLVFKGKVKLRVPKNWYELKYSEALVIFKRRPIRLLGEQVNWFERRRKSGTGIKLPWLFYLTTSNLRG